MAELDPAFHALARLHRALVEPEELGTTLDRIVALSLDAVPGCEQASITVATEGPSTAAYTSREAEALDKVQYHCGGGPCVHASHVREPVSMPDIATDDRWPAFCAEAVRQGFRSSLSYPMEVQGRSLGSINMYSRSVDGFDERSLRVAALFAEQGGIALANALNAVELLQLADQFRDGMRYRDMIGQAKGILMNQRKITADQAFEILREASQRQNRKLRDLAEDVAATGEFIAGP
jgi:GAF domain-containing protein